MLNVGCAIQDMSARPHSDAASETTERHFSSSHCVSVKLFIRSGRFSQKQAIVLPRLKKPTLDCTSLSSYRPISNLSFISKLLERVAADIFVGHSERNTLFLVHQSAYHHSHSKKQQSCAFTTTLSALSTVSESLAWCY